MLSTWAPPLPYLIAGIIVLGASFIGWGRLAWLLAGQSTRNDGGSPSLFELGVAGIAAIYVLAVLISLVSAFTPLLGDAVVIAGFASYATALWQRRRSASVPVHLVLMTVLAVPAAIGVVFAPVHYDTGLYHLQMLEWFRTGPLPLGLANLHGRFGFNSGWLTITALVGNTRLVPVATFLINGAALVVVCGALLQLGYERFRERRARFGALLAVVSVVVLECVYLQIMFVWMAASPATDIPAALLTMFALVSLAVVVDADTAGDERWRLTLCGIAAALAVAVKASQLPVLLVVAAAIGWLGLRRRRSPLPAAPLALLILGLWVLQGLMVSGCVLFPVAQSCAGWIPWSVDPAAATHHAEIARIWARAPGLPFSEVPGGLDWIPLWIEHMWPNRRFVLWIAEIGALLSLAALAASLLRRGHVGKSPPAPGFYWCVGAGAAGLLMTAAAAPDPRFCVGFLIILVASVVARILVSARLDESMPGRRVFAGLVVTILVCATAWNTLSLDEWLKKGGRVYWYRDLPTPRYEVVEAGGGLSIKTPAEGNQCWALPGACAPRGEFPPRLRQTRMFGRTAFVR